MFCPKYRYEILKGDITEYYTQPIFKLYSQKSLVEVFELNIQEEYVHTVLSITSKYLVSFVIGHLKGRLSARSFHQYEKKGKRY